MVKRFMSKFDDITESEGVWSQVCQSCVTKLGIPKTDLDDAGRGICGVKGCNEESDYYIDFE